MAATEQSIEIQRLRREIERLQRAEQGATSAATPPRPPPCGKEESSMRKATTPKRSTRCAACFIGWFFIAAAIYGIVQLVDFMKTNNIQLAPPGRLGGSEGGREVSLEEVAKHNSSRDCWMVLHGDVYDLTQYAKRHPGGSKWITDFAGTDGTEDYARFHSKSLLGSVAIHKIGPLQTRSSPISGSGSSSNLPSSPGSGTSPVVIECTAGESDCITMEELATHNTANDCWVAMHGKVYDLTDYARRHPGGARVVTNLAGTDGTTEYRRIHSPGLLGSVANTVVGRLQGSSIDALVIGVGQSSGDSEDSEDD